MRKRRKKKQQTILPLSIDELEQVLKKELQSFPDLMFSKYEHHGQTFAVICIPYMIQSDALENSLLDPLLTNDKQWTYDDLLNEIPLGGGRLTTSLDEILNSLLFGDVFIYIENETEIISYPLLDKEKRALEKAETESIVLGPKISFTESLMTNLNIIRGRIRSNDLVIEEYTIGSIVPSSIRLVYMKSIANDKDVQTMRQRLQSLDVKEIEDSVVLKQHIEDSQFSFFAQFDSTELPDRFAYAVTKGKVGVLVENSPTGIIGPSTLFSLLESTEDLYMRWGSGSILRLLRFFAAFFSIIITAIYVAVVTYHYSFIPTQLLITIGQSRAAVPFPPLLEALILEFMIELLREAGARLPTKVGQTMGIVGGIVIGQAAVAAGLTSNILIIFVAMSALASFTIPNYLLSTSIRLMRFPFIILAGFLGILGVMYGLCLLMIHLLRMKSLGHPYLLPLYPLHIRDFNKVFFRLPFRYSDHVVKFYRPKRSRLKTRS